ncbi:MAG: MFS transporter [Bacteroidota bacterium]
MLLFFLENGLSFAQVGLLYAGRELATNILEVPSGFIADLYGRKRALLASFLLYISSFLAFYWSTQFWLLMVAMIIFGLAEAFRSGTHKGMIMDYLELQGWKADKIEYYGLTRSWSQRGSALSALLAGILVFFSQNYRLIYLISVIPYMLNMLNVFLYPAAIDRAQKKRKTKQVWGTSLIDFGKVLRLPAVLSIVNSAALHGAFLKSIKDYIQPLMVQLAILLPILSEIEEESKNGLVIGVVYFGIYLLTAAASRQAGYVSQLGWANLAPKTLWLGLASGLISGVFIYLGWWILAIVVFIVVYLVENLRKPILTGFLVDEVPADLLTSVLSAQSFYKTMMTAILAIGLGFLADHWGVGPALSVLSGLLLLFSGGLEFYRKSRGQSA